MQVVFQHIRKSLTYSNENRIVYTPASFRDPSNTTCIFAMVFGFFALGQVHIPIPALWCWIKLERMPQMAKAAQQSSQEVLACLAS